MKKLEFLPPEREEDFIYGALLYEELTAGGTKSISEEEARKLTDKQIEAIFLYTFIKDFDFEKDIVAFESVDNCSSVLVERYPPKEPVEESLRKFKEKYKHLFK